MAMHATAQESVFALRETIARLEGRIAPALTAAGQARQSREPEAAGTRHRRLSLGIPAVDGALDGGVPLNGITEFRTAFFRDAGAATGFVLALAALLQDGRKGGEISGPILWIGNVASAREAGLPHAMGLLQFGLEPRQVLHALPRRLEEALWIAETALTSAAPAATILEVSGNPLHFGLTESRRLAIRARAAGRPLFLLRHAGEEEASSAFFRFRIAPAPALERCLPDGSMLGGSIGHPLFRLTLEKSRSPAPLSFTLEWNSRDRQFSLAEPSIPAAAGPEDPVDRPAAPADRPDRPAEMGALLAFGRAS